MHGEDSFDVDNDPFTYAWVQVSGSPTVTITGADTANPGFTAPVVSAGGAPGVVATLVFELAVDDGYGGSATDRVVINGDGTVLLRAERSGKGDGRVYRIYFTASDLEGSSSVSHRNCTDTDCCPGCCASRTLRAAFERLARRAQLD